MLDFVHDINTKVLFGKGCIEKLPEELAPLGRRVLLAYGGGSIKRTGLYDTIMKLLSDGGFEVTELSGIEPNPRIGSVREGVKLCRERGIEAVLAVGGGSVIDCAKAVACGVFFEGDPWDMIRTSRRRMKALPLAAVLTLSATGSEFDDSGVISNLETHEKLGAILTPPAVSFCDPTYTFTVSKYQTASGSADILSHIFEGYFSRTDDSDVFDGLAETVMKTVIKYTPTALDEPENYSARANLMVCSSIGCSGIPEYGKRGTGWPCHAMEHELSAYYDITHGVGLAILTPRWMRHILKKDPTVTPRFARFARNVFGITEGSEAELAEKGIDAIDAFLRSVGLPTCLSELGIGEEHFEAMAEHANRGGRLERAYVPLTKEDVIGIFRACL
ncbi:MAG: iron-containing alcohol dehydrogenase [Clostridiales bacterium]|nr:iron-containing alcohol dehydrogenase [Clostridiales bacterium]